MVQKRAAWWVLNRYSSYDSVSSMLSDLDWRSLKYRRYDSRLAMFYKNPVWPCCSANAYIFSVPKELLATVI